MPEMAGARQSNTRHGRLVHALAEKAGTFAVHSELPSSAGFTECEDVPSTGVQRVIRHHQLFARGLVRPRR